MFKLGLVSISFRNYSTTQILKAMNDSGLIFIEWGSDSHAPVNDIEALKKLKIESDNANVKCCSYGTYFRVGVNKTEEIYDYIKAAKILGTNVLRIWCGDKCSDDYTENERDNLFEDCKKLAKIAEENGVILCLECHNNTYTQTLFGALEIINTVNSDAFRMYWQPNQFRSFEENITYTEKIAQYTYNIHVFKWRGQRKFSLKTGVDEWREYLKPFSKDSALLLEFMPDDKIESLKTEADALREIVGEL